MTDPCPAAQCFGKDYFYPLFLLHRRQVHDGPEGPFRDCGRGQRVAESSNGLRDLMVKPEKPQNLNHTGTGDPQLAH